MKDENILTFVIQVNTEVSWGPTLEVQYKHRNPRVKTASLLSCSSAVFRQGFSHEESDPPPARDGEEHH